MKDREDSSTHLGPVFWIIERLFYDWNEGYISRDMRKSSEIPDRSRSSKTFSALRSLKRTQDEYFALYTVILIMMP